MQNESGLFQVVIHCLRKINIACVALLLGLMFSSVNGHAQDSDQIITLSSIPQSGKSLLALIEKQAGSKFSYDEVIGKKLEKKIALSKERASVKEVLGKICSVAGLEYTVANNYVIFKEAPAPVSKKGPGKVSGKIIDEENGQPVADVTIRIGNAGAASGIDGSFSIALPKGKYEAEISCVGYGKKIVTEIEIKDEEIFVLNLSIKREKNQLAGVVVKASAKKEGVNALLVRQKNAAEVSNGISAEQIAKTPDANLGEALKRITGTSTVDNKYVVVRGMGERYNTATLDGVVLPSTETSRRAFAFDLIPAGLIDYVTVSKTVTPDMNASFGGGLIQVNTKDIPDANFTGISVGTSYNTLSTGKTMYAPERGKYDYSGFDDGRRDFPSNLKRAEDEESFAQSKRFTKDNFSLYNATVPLSQNYQFSLGRKIKIDTSGKSFGIVGALSYRNNQTITEITDFRRGGAMPKTDNYGSAYGFNTTWGTILNAGIKLKYHRMSLRNTYTRKFEHVTNLNYQYFETADDERIATMPRNKRISIDPSFLDVLQNKLGVQHQFGKVKVDWDIARTAIQRNQKDVIRQEMYPEKINGEYVVTDFVTNSSQTGEFPMSRHHYLNKEKDYNWSISGSLPFLVASTRHIVKSGYAGNQRHLKFAWESTELNHFSTTSDSIKDLPLIEKIKPENLHPDGYVWRVQPWGIDYYEGKSRQHAGFLMLDNRFTNKLRLVWGMRGEYYKYDEFRNSASDPMYKPKGDSINKVPDAEWRWMPSANITYNLNRQLNLRAAYSRSMIRPEFMERARFAMYNPELDGRVLSANGLTSTRIDAYDLRVELFPGLGETFSVGGFYRYIDKPVEMEKRPAQDGRAEYILENSLWAKNYGVEFEFRKKLNFIADKSWLNDLSVFGNATYNKSEVQRKYIFSKLQENGTILPVEGLKKMKRPLYGQTPYMYNAGIQYDEKQVGINVVYNHTGHKMYIVGSSVNLNEYQRPYSQLDAQISYKFLKQGIEVKLNAGNLTDAKIEYYSNGFSYRQYSVEERVLGDDIFTLKPGFSDDYDNGDMKTFTQRVGRTFSLQISYNF